MPLSLPDRLKIGNLWYRVEDLDGNSADTHYGLSSQSDQYIRIAKALTDEQRAETFFHEVVHQVLNQGHWTKQSNNEKLVHCLAKGIYQVLHDNGLLRDA